MAQEGRVGHVAGIAGGHIERLAVAIDIAAERGKQRICGGQVGIGNPREVAPRERRLAGTHRQAVGGNHPGAVVGFHTDVLKVEAELNVVLSALPRRIVGQVVSVGRAALCLKLVDRIGEQSSRHDAGHVALRVIKVSVGEIEPAPNFIRQSGGRGPAPGERHQVGMGRAGDRGHSPVVVRGVGPVRVIAIVRVRSAQGVPRGDAVVQLAGQVIQQVVVALVEAVAPGVAAVADSRVVDLVARRHLRQDGLHPRVHSGKVPEGEKIHLAGDSAGRVGEDAVARIGGKNGKVLRHLLVRADALVAGVEK